MDGNADKNDSININLKGFAVGDPHGFDTIINIVIVTCGININMDGYLSRIGIKCSITMNIVRPNQIYIHQNLKSGELLADATNIVKDGV